MADIEDDKSMTSLENTARQAVLKILRIWQISKENLSVNITRNFPKNKEFLSMAEVVLCDVMPMMG